MAQIHSNRSLKSIFGITLMAATLGLTACSTPVDPDVKARQDIMKNFGDAMKVMGGMAKEPDTFDADVFKEQAAFLATHGHQVIAEGSSIAAALLHYQQWLNQQSG